MTNFTDMLSKAKEMPLKLFLNFFINHGLFKFKNRPQWYTVSNRSKTYVNNVLKKKVVPLIVPAKEKNFFMVSFYKYQN